MKFKLSSPLKLIIAVAMENDERDRDRGHATNVKTK